MHTRKDTSPPVAPLPLPDAVARDDLQKRLDALEAELKLLRRALQESRQRYDDLFGNMGEGLVIGEPILDARIETGWAHGDFQKSVWGSRLVNKSQSGDTWKVAFGLTYRFRSRWSGFGRRPDRLQLGDRRGLVVAGGLDQGHFGVLPLKGLALDLRRV